MDIVCPKAWRSMATYGSMSSVATTWTRCDVSAGVVLVVAVAVAVAADDVRAGAEGGIPHLASSDKREPHQVLVPQGWHQGMYSTVDDVDMVSSCCLHQGTSMHCTLLYPFSVVVDIHMVSSYYLHRGTSMYSTALVLLLICMHMVSSLLLFMLMR